MAKDGDTLTAELQLSITEEVSRQVAPLKAKAESLLDPWIRDDRNPASV